MILRKIFNAFKVIVTNIYYRCSYDVCELSIGDIMLKRVAIDSCQFTACTRLLDVKHYEHSGVSDFPYQNTISRKLWGVNHQEEKGNRNFEELICSYKKNGFDNNSLFELDKQIVLLNGTHRTSCNIYFNYNIIRARVLRRCISQVYLPLKQLALDLEPKFTEEVMDEYDNIQKYLIETGNTFVALMTSDIYSKICHEIKHLVTILKVSDFIDLNGVVGFEGKMVQFSLAKPDYKIVDHRLCSCYATTIRDLYCNRYNGGGILFSLSCLEGVKLFNSVAIRTNM